MTARKPSAYAPNVDAISRGFSATLLAWPDPPTAPTEDFAARCARAAGRESALFELDDWHRGVALARECMLRAFAGMRDVGRLPKIARLAVSGATDLELEDWSAEEIEAWDLLCTFEANVSETGDPDLSTDPAGEDDEQHAGDDEQGAVLSRLRWETIDGRRVLTSAPWEGEA